MIPHDQVERIRKQLADGRSIADVANAQCLSWWTVWRIKRGKTYRQAANQEAITIESLELQKCDGKRRCSCGKPMALMSLTGKCVECVVLGLARVGRIDLQG